MQTPRRAVTPSSEPPAPSPFFRYRFADVDYDESLGLLRVAGVEVDIEPRPRELLSELLRRPNEVVAREELMEALWQGRPTVDNVLANAITKLRRALGPEGAERLVNVPRVGYRLAGPIERVAVGQHASSLPALVAGERVPGREAYLLEAPLGRGAAPSLVWRARDPKLQDTRIFKFAADGERLGALKREYTLYRVLRAELGERDDFARVVAANFGTAPYFIECEDGGPDLLAWADADHRLAGCSTAQRIALFLQIARAVAAAHGVGVLHKDLKPANVLVSATGDGWQTRLTDFGSSRLLEPGRLAALGVTAMGLTVTHGVGSDSTGGTPLYLAPELLAGRSPTTQSDLYALGLMLWQLVVGDLRRPMSTGWQREVADALLIEDIAAATEGRPEDRLGSVAELVERLQTLDDRREKARAAAEAARRAEAIAADSARRRARRPWLAAAFVALAAGLAASLWFYGQARAALRTAQQESARATAINDFLAKDVLQSKDVIRAGTKKTVSMLEVLRNASSHVAERFKGQPLDEAAVRFQLGKTYLRMASTTEAGQEFGSALKLALPRLPPDDTFLMTLRLWNAELLMRTMEDADAPQAVRDIDSVLQAAGPARLQARTEFAFLASRLDFERLRRFDKEREALPSGERMVMLADTVPAVDMETRLETRQRLAELYLVLGEPAKAEALLAEAMRSPAGAGEAAESAYASAMLAMIGARWQAGDRGYVDARLRPLAEHLARTLGRENLHYGTAQNELARRYVELGDAPHAVEALREARHTYTEALGPEHQYAKVTESNLAMQLVDAGHPADGLQLLDAITPWFAAHTTHRYWPLVEARTGALIGLGRPAEALAVLDAVPVAEWADAGEMRWKLDGLRGRALVGVGRRAEGAAVLKSAVEAGAQLGDGPALAALRRALDSAAK